MPNKIFWNGNGMTMLTADERECAEGGTAPVCRGGIFTHDDAGNLFLDDHNVGGIREFAEIEASDNAEELRAQIAEDRSKLRNALDSIDRLMAQRDEAIGNYKAIAGASVDLRPALAKAHAERDEARKIVDARDNALQHERQITKELSAALEEARATIADQRAALDAFGQSTIELPKVGADEIVFHDVPAITKAAVAAQKEEE